MERIKRFSELYENELTILVEGRAFINAAKKAKELQLEMQSVLNA